MPHGLGLWGLEPGCQLVPVASDRFTWKAWERPELWEGLVVEDSLGEPVLVSQGPGQLELPLGILSEPVQEVRRLVPRSPVVEVGSAGDGWDPPIWAGKLSDGLPQGEVHWGVPGVLGLRDKVSDGPVVSPGSGLTWREERADNSPWGSVWVLGRRSASWRLDGDLRGRDVHMGPVAPWEGASASGVGHAEVLLGKLAGLAPLRLGHSEAPRPESN